MDYIIAILELLGAWIVGNKNKYGYVFLILSNSGWIIYVLVKNQTHGLLIVCIPALAISVRNFIKWSHDG
jgi:hypothetical protein